MKLILKSQIYTCKHLLISIDSCTIRPSSESVCLALVISDCKILKDRHRRAGSLGRILEHAANSSVADEILLLRDINTIHNDGTSINWNRSADNVEHRCLTRSVASDHRYELSVFNFQIKIIKQADLIDRAGIIHFMNMI